ncbi:hypothetical protein [Paenibacillus terrigena]|uniref:hypothetical protein n=1 Tax=Paenibacillus terrigena TaxID=369333 RepID=UPI000366E9CF|nr:hypothetical protein [Paenibacillus terrigena]
MNCYYHPEIEASVQCHLCHIHLCDKCHDAEHPGHCYSCALQYRNGSIRLKGEKIRHVNRAGTIRKIIGWYEIIGGIVGILITFGLLLRLSELNNLVVTIISLIFVALYLMSCLAGFLLLQDMKSGYSLSMIVQAFQFPQFVFQGVTYTFIAGSQFTVQWMQGIDTVFKTKIGLFSEFNFYIQLDSNVTLIGINFVPIVIIYVLIKQLKVRTTKVRRELTSEVKL